MSYMNETKMGLFTKRPNAKGTGLKVGKAVFNFVDSTISGFRTINKRK